MTIMTIYDIRVIAKNVGIDPAGLNKRDLIRSIQLKVGRTSCFKTAIICCDHADCLWKSDCLKLQNSTTQNI